MLPVRKSAPVDWYVYMWPWPILKVKVKIMQIFTVNISQAVTDMTNIAIANTYMKSPIGFPLMYLHLTLGHSKRQSQGHENFDCEYLVSDDK